MTDQAVDEVQATRYFSYYEPCDGPDGYSQVGNVVTLTEDDIRDSYYPYWYDRMCDKFGQDIVDSDYGFSDCLYDWVVEHHGWEIEVSWTI